MKQRITHLILLFALCASAQAQYPLTRRFVRPDFAGQLYWRLDSLNRMKITPKTGSEQAVKIDSSNVINLGPKLAQLKQIATVTGDTTTLPASGSVYLRQIGHSIGTIGATGKFNHIAPSLSSRADFADCFTPYVLWDGDVWLRYPGTVNSSTLGYQALIEPSATGTHYRRRINGPLNIKWWGVTGAQVDTSTATRTYVTQQINKAFAFIGAQNNPATLGAYSPSLGWSNTLRFDHGLYFVNDEINTYGSVHIEGEENTSFGGTRWIQTKQNKSLFRVKPGTDGASVGVTFRGGIMKSGAAPGSDDTALIAALDSATDGNNSSLYVERVTFQTPPNWAIRYKVGDDLKVGQGTFDVIPVSAIYVGSAAHTVTQVEVTGNTFFRVSNNVLKTTNVKGLIYSNNKAYDTDDNGNLNTVFLQSDGVAENFTVTGNELYRVNTGLILSSSVTSLAYVGNVSEKQIGRTLYMTGTGTMETATFVGNTVKYASAPTAPTFDGQSANLQYCTFIGNSISSPTSTTVPAFYFPGSSTLYNEFFGNTAKNFTTKYSVNQPLLNGIFFPANLVQGDSPTSRTSYVTTLSADTPSGFFKYNGTSGMPSDPSGFNEWLGIRIRNETSTASGGAAWITDLVVNEKTKTMYVGGNDAQANTRNSFDRIWSKSALPFQENATHSSLYMWAYNATNSQYEPTSPANIRSVVLGLGSMATQSGSGVAITGGTVSGVAITASSIPLSNVTGAGSMAAQNSTAVNASGVFSGTFTGTATTTTTGLFIPSSGQINQSAGSSVSGGNTVMTSQATGTNGTSGYAEIQTLYGGVGYTAPLVFQRQGGAVLIGTSTNDGVNKLQVNGSAVATSISATNAAVTNFTATNSTVTTETVGTLNVTGSVAMGNTSNTSTATPLTLNMGGTYSNTAGANPKLKLADIGGTVFGLGVSANQMDFTIPNGSRYNYYVNGASVMSAGAASVKTGVDISITDTTKGFVLKSPDGTCYRITVANGGTLSTASITCP